MINQKKSSGFEDLRSRSFGLGEAPTWWQARASKEHWAAGEIGRALGDSGQFKLR